MSSYTQPSYIQNPISPGDSFEQANNMTRYRSLRVKPPPFSDKSNIFFFLFRSAHFLSPVQNTIHGKVTACKVTTAIGTDTTTFSQFKTRSLRNRCRGSQGSERSEQKDVEKLHCIVFQFVVLDSCGIINLTRLCNRTE